MSKYIEITKDIDFSECGLQALEVAIREEAYPIIEQNFEKLVYYWIMCRYIKEFSLDDDIMGIYEWFKHEMLDVMIVLSYRCSRKQENEYATIEDGTLHDILVHVSEKYANKDTLRDRTLTVGDELEQAYVGSDNAYLLSRNVTELLNEEIHNVFTVKERMEDFTLPYEDYMFYPILKKSNLCNIPDNVTWDWLDVIQKFLEIMDKYPQAVRDKDRMLPVIKERVKDILKKRAEAYYDELYRSFYED